MSLRQGLVSEGRVHVEHLLDRGYVRVSPPQMIEEPYPEDRDGGVVLVGIAPDAGGVPDGETDDSLGVGEIARLVEDRPGESEVGPVPEVLAFAGQLQQTQPVGEVERAHSERSCSSRNDTWIAARKRSESGSVS